MHPLWKTNCHGPSVGEKEHINGQLAVVKADGRYDFLEHFLRLGKAGYHILLQPEGLTPDHQKALKSIDTSGLKEQSIFIRTGGTSGGLRFCIHTTDTLWNAALSQCEFLNIRNTVCVLPFWHVSGLMQFVRKVVTNGVLTVADLSRLELPSHKEETVLSLVPTQLYRLLGREDGLEWLRPFKAILLGGAAAEDTLLQRARDAGLFLAPCYGMTETAAFVTYLKPDEFLSGRGGVGKPLPHVRIQIRDTQGAVLPAGKVGRIHIAATSLAVAYWPEAPFTDMKGWFATGDKGYLDDEDYLYVTGRIDRLITTGGETVDPSEIERVLKQEKLVKDIHVAARPDIEWGEILVAHAVPVESGETVESLRNSAKNCLSAPEVPKEWLLYEALPRNKAGKLESSRLKEL